MPVEGIPFLTLPLFALTDTGIQPGFIGYMTEALFAGIERTYFQKLRTSGDDSAAGWGYDQA